jgi:hypothetical protein
MLRGCRRTFADIVRGRRSGSDAFAAVAETKWRQGGTNGEKNEKRLYEVFEKEAPKKREKTRASARLPGDE